MILMSKNSYTELETGLDTDTVENISKTVESEFTYKSYINRERKIKNKKRIEKLNEKIDKETREQNKRIEKYKNNSIQILTQNTEEINPELTDNTCKITCVESIKNTNKFKISYIVKDNTEYHRTIPMGLPENKSSKWVRLCAWTNSNPTRPTELKDKIAPLKIGLNVIDIPPRKGGLNYPTYKLKRLLKIFNTKRISKIVYTSIDILIPLIITTISIIFGYIILQQNLNIIGMIIFGIISIYISVFMTKMLIDVSLPYVSKLAKIIFIKSRHKFVTCIKNKIIPYGIHLYKRVFPN